VTAEARSSSGVGTAIWRIGDQYGKSYGGKYLVPDNEWVRRKFSGEPHTDKQSVGDSVKRYK